MGISDSSVNQLSASESAIGLKNTSLSLVNSTFKCAFTRENVLLLDKYLNITDTSSYYIGVAFGYSNLPNFSNVKISEDKLSFSSNVAISNTLSINSLLVSLMLASLFYWLNNSIFTFLINNLKL